MTTTIHRQIGRMGKRSADDVWSISISTATTITSIELVSQDASVAMIIKEVHDAETLLGKLLEHTKAWRDAWSSILVNQVNLTDSFHDVYKTIPMPGDSKVEVLETPTDTLRRVATLHAAQNDLKADMMDEIEKVDRLLVERLGEAKAALKPVKKAIEKRENKKLDYERFNKQVENSRSKKNKSDREYSVLSKAEMDAERSKNAYENADEHIRSFVPPLLAKIVEFVPCIVEFIVITQYTLLQNTYSAIYEYANDYGYTDPEGAVVISEWESQFLPIQQHLESEITFIARGKAITMPMNVIVQEKSIIPRLGRTNKPPPPPPPSNPPGGAPSYQEKSPIMNRFQTKFTREEAPPPPPPVSSRPSIRSRPSNSNLSAHSRDESPPPPLPGPRPGTANPQGSSDGGYKSVVRSRSYGGNTPLATVAQRHAVDPPTSNYLSPKLPSEMPRRKSDSAGEFQAGGSVQERLAAIRAGQNSLARVEKVVGNGGAPRPPVSRHPTGASMASMASVSSYRSAASDLSSIAGKKKPPPPPPPKKKKIGLGQTWVRALYDFDGQDTGDLSFREGEKILVVRKTESVDDWWEGELNGRKGQFPANYTEIV
ncbi:uncharacterized protein H6S33_006420 [Morchella sextelata]|uniref:uncharacterized protein n=1 Tax=Morchella sextelata TaxID=1174677 RepID=UPI001D050127|nr:uncharacterized protein H6S33_006420 [Morchella sextelata]KAH0604752.1 hypothetical protein H6S33_006420 [Morchella sextelata]